MKSLRIAIVLIGVVAATTGHALERDSDLEWSTEAGFLAGYHDNYFFRGEKPKPSETFLTIYGLGELAYDVGPGDLLFEAGGLGAFGLEIDKTDFQALHAGVGWKQGRGKTMLSYRRTFDKVFGEEDDASLYDVDSLEANYRHKLTEKLRGQIEFQWQNWDFSSPDNDRDAYRYQPQGLIRWEIWDFLAVRGAFFWTWKEADSGRYDYDGPGFAIATEIKPADPLEFFIRYRRRWRDYDNAPSGDSNYKRNDTIDDVVANARWKLIDWFGLRLEGNYRHGNSDRQDRNYDAYSVTGGFFVTFGSEN